MNSKNIKKHLKAKVRDWADSIQDESVKKMVLENTIITGDAIVSLLTGNKVNDYDVYFRTQEAVVTVAAYYIDKWNNSHPDKPVSLRVNNETGRVDCFVRSKGIADEDENQKSVLAYNQDTGKPQDEDTKTDDDKEKEKYRPRFITSNAISLSDKVQVVIRFYGEIEEIHKNYDFAHCTCAWSSWDNEVMLPVKALECIINKELYYIGSKSPLCSIVRTRKYIERGYHINAGQYVKMFMQLNELDLTDVEVLEDQLTGVDTAYSRNMVEMLKKQQEETGNQKVDLTYAMQIVNKLFRCKKIKKPFDTSGGFDKMITR